MVENYVKLAETLGVTPGTISKAKKKLGIEAKSLTKEQETAITNYLQGTSLMTSKGIEEITSSDDFKADVRQIDKEDGSSLNSILQDAKEQYVKNQEMIQRLQYELSNLSSTIHMNGNRTFSAAVQFKPLESLLKINIQLRNQILNMEEMLGKMPKSDSEQDPFE